MGQSVKLKHSIDDQIIIDNCLISKMKIGYVESVNGSYLGKSVGTSEANTSSNSL